MSSGACATWSRTLSARSGRASAASRFPLPSQPSEPHANAPPSAHALPTRPSAAKRATAPHGQNQAKILAALKGSQPMTASEIARLTGISASTVSTTLTKMAKTGELTKAERGYRLPG